MNWFSQFNCINWFISWFISRFNKVIGYASVNITFWETTNLQFHPNRQTAVRKLLSSVPLSSLYFFFQLI